METAKLSVEASTRYLMALGYRVSAPLNADGSSTANVGETEHSLCRGFTGAYSLGLHVGALFLILFVSLLGTAIPILGKCIPSLVRYPYVFSVAKSAATGVLLSVSTIHLIFEGAEAFSEDCIPAVLKSYGPLYFLLALIAVLLMQALDMQLADIAERWMKAKLKREAEAAKAESKGDGECCGLSPDVDAGVTSGLAPADGPLTDERKSTSLKSGAQTTVPVAALDDCEVPLVALSPEHPVQHHHCDEPAAHGHQHLSVAPPRDMGSFRYVISAVCMEFGVTLHSVFVGLDVGLKKDSELKPLLVALVFHQLFEGMAVGSRLVDAKFSATLDVVLALVFSLSAPAGMAAAAIAVSVSPSAMSGSGFATVVAVLDTLCGGILLYLAFTLLLGDFVADVKHYCCDGQGHRTVKKIMLFVSLWVGMGLMALVGNWL
ncbi:ZIP Zinc transporter family protein [Leishmania donovani]|uniref:ZIP Zinc transporter family protein n=1 Tax=Leishmania donovani TaxID=5661 RepID=A0A504XY04_LEIDO|nr:ZIP Zinc transporter family protein [Leishmania donovani]TPP49997.1 ZIP Zinc transporter family protein [Leishmania donovani]TPP49998.1 ZIP Zinc transporter family protein [Leishmania donovani]TPP49999.1 ZIP Zinc transporter family protein [Leishmania donovani]